MDFASKVVLSFLVGGAYISGVIWVSERLGSRLGGAIAGLPSTILVGLAFINIIEGPAAARSAVSIVPLMFSVTLIYALVFIRIAARVKSAQRHLVATLAATLAWVIASLPVRYLFSEMSFIFIVILALVGLFGFNYSFRHFATTPPNKIPLPRHIYVFRFLVGGVVVAGAVLAARLLGPFWAGIISSFPALLGSVLYFLNKSQGSKFLEGFLRRLPLSYLSSFIFLVIVHQALTKLSGVLAFIIAMAGALGYTLLLISSSRTLKNH